MSFYPVAQVAALDLRFPRAIDSALTQCILRGGAGLGVLRERAFPISPTQITSPAIKRIPHITHLLIANLILRFLWNVCHAHFLAFVFTEMVIFERGRNSFFDDVMLIFVFCLYRDGNF